MSVTIDLKTLFLILLFIALIILIIYAAVMIKKLLVTLDRTNKILEDVQVTTKIVADRSKDVDGIIGNISESVASVSSSLKGSQTTVAAVASIAKSLASLRGLVAKKDKGKKE